MQRSLHRFISLTAADLRKLRKEGRRGSSQSRVLPIETDRDTNNPVQEYTQALIGEVRMGLLDAVACRTEIFRQQPTEDNTPITSQENSPIGSITPSSISTPNLSTFSSPNPSRRPSVVGGRRTPNNNENGGIGSPFSSPNVSRRNSLTQVGLDTLSSTERTPPQSQCQSTNSSPCPTPRSSNSTPNSSFSRNPSLFFSQRTLECFLDNCTDVDSLNPLHHAAKGGHTL